MVKWGANHWKNWFGHYGSVSSSLVLVWCGNKCSLNGIQASAGPIINVGCSVVPQQRLRQSVSHNLVIFRQLRWKPHKFGYTWRGLGSSTRQPRYISAKLRPDSEFSQTIRTARSIITKWPRFIVMIYKMLLIVWYTRGMRIIPYWLRIVVRGNARKWVRLPKMFTQQCQPFKRWRFRLNHPRHCLKSFNWSFNMGQFKRLTHTVG